MNEKFENMKKLDLFKSYHKFSEENIITIVKEYDEKYVKEINNLSALISTFISNIKSYIIAISKVCSTIKNQIHYSQFLIEEIHKKREKYSQLCDRIEMISNTSKLLDNHLVVSNNNLNIFVSEAKKEFKEIKELRIEKWNKIKMIQNLRNNNIYNQSSSRGKMKKNIYEIEAYNSIDNIYSPNQKDNIYNNFVESSNFQKKNLLENPIGYRKMNLNLSQENFYSKKNINLINKRKHSSVIKEKNSRNKNNNFQNSLSTRNNSSVCMKNTERSRSKTKRNNSHSDINSIELKLAYKVIEFIFFINNLQLDRISNDSELKNKIEKLKDNLLNLTNEVINQNKSNQKYKNKNIINNNFIYNNKENLEINDDNNIFSTEERDYNSNKLNNLYGEIEKLKTKNQDLELLVKIKNKENQKLNNIIHNNQIFQSFQGNNNIKIENNSSEKVIIKHKNNDNKFEESNKNKNNIKELNQTNDIALILNKKIEDLNVSLAKIRKEKNQLNNDLLSKNNLIKELKTKLNSLLNKNKNRLLIIDQQNKINLFFKYTEPKIEIEEYKNKYTKLELEKKEPEKELEKEKKKTEKIDTNEIVKLHNKISEYKNKLEYYKENYKKQQAEMLINNNDIINEKDSSKDSYNIDKKENDYNMIKEDSKEDSEIDNKINSVNQNKKMKQKNIIKLEKKIKTKDSNSKNNRNNGIDYEQLINNFTKDIKDKDKQIDDLNNQIQKLKALIDNKEYNKIDIIKNQDKTNINEYESKMLLLKEKNTLLQNNLNSFDDKIQHNERNIEELKNNINIKTDIKTDIKIELKITKIDFCLLAKNKIKYVTLYSPDKYDILCDKYYQKFHWFLLINKKDNTESIINFHKMFWAEKRELINIENFNKYTSEVEEENKSIMKYISKLEEKEDKISKLTFRLNQLEKLNSSEDNNSGNNKLEKLENLITKEKYNNLISKIKKLEDELNILRQENIALKENNFNDVENEEYNKFEERLKNGEIQMSENMQKIVNNHFNSKIEANKDDSMDNNYINSSKEENEIEKITEKIEENESEEDSESSHNQKKELFEKETTKNKNFNILRKQLERITGLYEGLEKRLKKIKNQVKKIFSNLVIKEKEKEINKLLEICGFTEEEISEMFLFREDKIID